MLTIILIIIVDHIDISNAFIVIAMAYTIIIVPIHLLIFPAVIFCDLEYKFIDSLPYEHAYRLG